MSLPRGGTDLGSVVDEGFQETLGLAARDGLLGGPLEVLHEGRGREDLGVLHVL